MHDTLGELARLSATLAGSRQDLVGTITELQSFVSTLAVHDAQVRRLSTQLADVTTFLAAERGDLGAALRQLSVTLGDVAAFVRDHRAVLKSNVNQLSTLTAVLVAQRVALAEILDVAPTGLGNVANAYHAAHGTLDARANIEELRGAAEALGALRADAPPPLPPLPLLAVPTVPGGR
jgi:ABC-type transporter Mla subunit MlaD